MTKKRKNDRLWKLWEDIDRYAMRPDRRLVLTREIWAKWGAPRAVMVTDLCRFSHLTRTYGIIHFLAVIRLSHLLCFPPIRRHRGTIIKVIADDILATFPSPDNAILAAQEMQRETRRHNRTAPKPFKIGLGIGIEYGKVLQVEAIDVFGDPVNTASKLGEDLADGGSVLVGPEAAAAYCARHPDENRYFRERAARASGVDFAFYQYLWDRR